MFPGSPCAATRTGRQECRRSPQRLANAPGFVWRSLRVPPRKAHTCSLWVLGSPLAGPVAVGQFLDANIAEVEPLAFGLDADVTAVSVQLLELPGPLAIHIKRDLPAPGFHAELHPFV